jgi:hypothetical protein
MATWSGGGKVNNINAALTTATISNPQGIQVDRRTSCFLSMATSSVEK